MDNKRKSYLIAAVLIIIPTAILLLLTLFVQPFLPAPWNNLLIILGVVVAAVLAGLSGLADTLQLADRLSGGDKEGQTPTVVSEQGVAIGQVTINSSTPETAAAAFLANLSRPKPDLNEITIQYLEYLITKYRYLDFKGMGVSDRIPLRLPLLEMYVPLQARIEMPEGETWSRELKLAGRQVSEEEVESMGRRMSEPQPVLQLLRENNGLIILGDPGAGKTTFLKMLVLRLALGEDIGLGQRLPVLLPLSAYANALAQKDMALDDFVTVYYRDLLGDDLPVGQLLDEALKQGQALLLLDGLDEVKESGRRRVVVNRVEHFFALQQQRGNKFILSSRIVGYREVRPVAEGLAECTLVDFGDTEIELFVNQWTKAIEEAAQGQTEVAITAAEQEKKELLLAMENNPGVRRLAANPLLLTILALMKRQGVVLPERRVELYEQYVQTLLKHWNLARGLDRPPVRDLDVVETVRVLAPLALWMHETSPGVGLVKQQDVRRQLIRIYTDRSFPEPELAANQLLDDARNYAGMLVERGQGMYGFIHLTFQEYLAAVAVAQKGQRTLQPVVDYLADRLDDDNWHEVILLAIGYLGIVQQRDEAAGEVLMMLVEQAPGTPGQAEIIAGEAVVDTWPGGVTRPCRERVQDALLSAMRADQRVKPAQRAGAGWVLARLEDPRPEVMTVDNLQFCYVPAGPFWMGSEDGNDDEKPQHWMELDYGYWLGRYPVTFAQFHYFEAAGGYLQSAYWPEAKKAGYWKTGQGFRKRTTPTSLGFPINSPVTGISWYEALAYTRWLTECWQQKEWLPPGWCVCLPSEAEWEKAVQGGDNVPQTAHIRSIITLAAELDPKLTTVANAASQDRYIWGDEADANRANFGPSGINSSNAVGCFPGGVSPYGVEEMTGNIFEWTRSKHAQYEYVIDDGREQIDASNDLRILRGGYFGDGDGTWLRCAFRFRFNPFFDHWSIGMRLCVSPFSP